jgi:hypothetical protein
MENIEDIKFDDDYYYLYLHHYADTNITFVNYEKAIYKAISKLLEIPEFIHSYSDQKDVEICVLTGL